jgi:uncharacterized protein YidB (DUF937 family)
MSGVLGQLLGNVLGGQAQSGAIAGVLQQVLVSNGGVAGLVSRFESAGLGSQAASWVGTGQNMPVSPEQVGQVFPDQQVEQWAEQAGTTPDKLRAVLAEALPQAVDHSTPNGQVPATMPDVQSIIGHLFANPTR